jgi:hypothetical protein
LKAKGGSSHPDADAALILDQLALQFGRDVPCRDLPLTTTVPSSGHLGLTIGS